MNLAGNSQHFYLAYRHLEEKEQEQFAMLASRLLNHNFICRDHEKDKKNYYAILPNQKMFENYFSILNYEMIFDKTLGVIGLYPANSLNRLNLTKIQTIALLILRKIYFKRQHEISSMNKIVTTAEEIYQELLVTGLFENVIPKTEFKQIIQLFKRHNLCDYSGDLADLETVIIIQPAIIYVVSTETLEEVEQQIQKYERKEERVDEETDEDQID
ncbi:hypothetical protein A5844_001896 [Enterococcus sp. 10A9_DIV0425]|uniref:DUF4194 domain-containing protein n=1 Tax=Candidatus Enterococcus wittei TaxID=1987383 RepID=A0A242JY05_9ENTE|nr:DUF4194 domain-containing protein [Enterococcus sp. 10A9_DIV0425]OTP10198.1 hypothetical protein A5844_001896 [Enterococcus sp. 10A9_DIV0425]THE14637.1 DUF4194 domain-containing protein [Enterococcus hirae]